MGLFSNKDDGLMKTAVRLCWLKCKFFPTPADITEAIKDLTYDAQTKPKQLPARSNWTSPAAQKVFDMVRQDKVKDYIANMDISDVTEYARTKFTEISDTLIRKNYAELAHAKHDWDMCEYCKLDSKACLTHGWYAEPTLNSDGWIVNKMAKCQKWRG